MAMPKRLRALACAIISRRFSLASRARQLHLRRANPIMVCLSLVAAILSLHPVETSASEPNCYPWQSTGYCQYNGKVSRAYVNAYDQLILYFDTPLNPANAAAVGLTGVTVTNAATYNMATNREAGKMLFAAMLSAQARGATVEVQMMSVSGGYLVMDRIWVLE